MSDQKTELLHDDEKTILLDDREDRPDDSFDDGSEIKIDDYIDRTGNSQKNGNSRKKKNNGLIVILVIILVLLAGLLAFAATQIFDIDISKILPFGEKETTTAAYVEEQQTESDTQAVEISQDAAETSVNAAETSVNAAETSVNAAETGQNTAETSQNKADNTVQQDSAAKYVTIDSEYGGANFRSGPGTDYSIISTVANGEIIYITEVHDDADTGLSWGRAVYNGVDGWVSLSQTTY